MPDSQPRIGWIVLASVAGAIALTGISRWVWAVTANGPVLYSEGAVAHAALLSRSGLEYTPGAAAFETTLRPIFTAANYPPLFFKVAGLGDPFVVGRIASIASTLVVAGAIAWRAWRAGPLIALALALAWLATFPVIVWGPAVKPDLLALALTVGAVVALDATPRRAVLAGALVALAIWTKPTAALPAAALALWLLREDRALFARYSVATVIGSVALGLALIGPAFLEPLLKGGCCGWAQHVIAWNALPWSAEQAALLLVVAAVTLGVPVVVLGATMRGATAAYALAAATVMFLGGREGATVNYLLDLSAAIALAAATAAASRRHSLAASRIVALAPVAVAVQLVVSLASFDPLGLMPGQGTGAWGDPARVTVIRTLPNGPVLAEDAGLLIAAGREPIVDDLFLLSRLQAHLEDRKRLTDPARFEEGRRVIGAAVNGRFVAVVSEVDLEHLDRAPAYERARWHQDLVEPVLARYRLDRTERGLWVYLPK